jgi:hypothetical protein
MPSFVVLPLTPCIDDVILIPLVIEIGLEVVRVTLARIGAVTGGKAVSEADDERA